MNKAAEENVELVDLMVATIAKEMSGMKRLSFSYQLSRIIEGNRDEILRLVEEKTKAKDRGRVLTVIDQVKP